jgi:hypothetical protein
MTDLERAAYHEGGHVVCALHFSLPLRSVFINSDGSGGTTYTRRFSWGEVDVWNVTTLAGPAAEADAYGSAAEGGDLGAFAK